MQSREKLVPQFFKDLRGYDKASFIRDLSAGITVGVVALPLAIAFGIASGVSPTEGILTAVLGGFLVSFLGGSKVQIGGPTGAFIVIVAGIIQQHGLDGLAISTVMAGIILMLLGFMRLGAAVKFVPYPIIVGFTAGIAVTIFTTQVKDFLGLQIEGVPADFIGKWQTYFAHLDTWDPIAPLFGIATILIIVLLPRVAKKLPASLVALIVLTIVSFLLERFGLVRPTNIGDNFTFESALPEFRTPAGLTLDRIRELVPSAITIAVLGAIESLLSASVADGMIGAKHDSNMELIGQGVANVVVPFFGGIPVTGAIARTMTNINSGGRTPVAGVIHAIVLLLIMLFLSPLTAHIPMAVLAGVLMVVSYNMSGWHSFIAFFRGPRADLVLLLVTFFLTVVIDLTVAITVGMVMAMLVLVRRVMLMGEVTLLDDDGVGIIDPNDVGHTGEPLPKGIEVYEIEGPLFFGIANKFEETMRELSHRPIARIIRMRRVPFIDATGIYNLKMLIEKHQKAGVQIILSGVQPEVRATIERVGVTELLGGDDYVLPYFSEASKRAIELYHERKREEQAHHHHHHDHKHH